jgi:hypothetical protein
MGIQPPRSLLDASHRKPDTPRVLTVGDVQLRTVAAGGKGNRLHYARERVELSRAIATGKGQRLDRARQVDPLILTEALRLYDDGVPVAEIEQRMNITRSASTDWRRASEEVPSGSDVAVVRGCRRRPAPAC